MKFLLIFILSHLFFLNAFASVRIGDWMRRESGHPHYLPYGGNVDPVELCRNAGGRIPTAREMAEWASRPCTQTLQTECGAQGIRETQFPNVDAQDPRVQHEALSMPHGFIEVAYGRENQPSIDFIDFYFNGDGFIPGTKSRDTPSTIVTSGARFPKGQLVRTYFVLEPEYENYFDYGWAHWSRDREGGVRCAFDY